LGWNRCKRCLEALPSGAPALAALFNSLFLFAVTVVILYAGIGRLLNPQPVLGLQMLAVAVVSPMDAACCNGLVSRINAILCDKYDIEHATIQIDAS